MISDTGNTFALLPMLKPIGRPAGRVLRRLEQIEALPTTQQSVFLKTIDTLLENATLKSARRA